MFNCNYINFNFIVIIIYSAINILSHFNFSGINGNLNKYIGINNISSADDHDFYCNLIIGKMYTGNIDDFGYYIGIF